MKQKTIKIGNVYRIISHQDNDSTTSLLIGLSTKVIKKFKTSNKYGENIFIYEGIITSEGQYQGYYHKFLINELDEYNRVE